MASDKSGALSRLLMKLDVGLKSGNRPEACFPRLTGLLQNANVSENWLIKF
jgi:hypothetical protein